MARLRFGSTLLFLAAVGLTNLASPVSAQKRIYIAPDDHTDYMWTADEATYQQSFLTMIDYYLNQMDATAGNPSAQQARWNCDGNFWMWTYERNRTPAQFDRFMNRVRDHHMSVPLTALVGVYGGTPAEAVLRGMYYPGRIERRYNVRFPMAVAMENQTLPYGLGSLWTGAGAKWSWRGICGCASNVTSPGDREHDIYWWTGPDNSRILMKWNTLFNNQSIGGYAEARDPVGAINLVNTNPTFLARYPYPVIGIFGKGWDDLQTTTTEFVTTAQSQTNANQQVIVSNEEDFFADFEQNHGAGLPSQSCSFGNEWELYVASMAEESARVKRSVEKLRTAEALATLVSLRVPGFMNGRTTQRDQAMMDLGLYFEHDWTADGPVSRADRAAWQRRLAEEIEGYVNTLQTDAAAALGGLIRKQGTNPRFYAFNPLSWTRTDYADWPYADTNPVHVIDLSTGQETPSQIVMVDGQRKLRVLAANVPSVGYKVFEVQPGTGTVFSPAATITGNVLENANYRITVADRGAVTSLIDKTRGNREFVRTVNGRVINDLGAGTGALTVENAGPVTVTLKATATGTLNHVSRITLLRDSPRIDIRNDITQNFGSTNSWTFSFELNTPDVYHEEVGAVIRAKLLAQGGDYSPRQARYDWLTLNHFADMSNGALGVTLSNADCYYMQLGNSTTNTLDTATPQLKVLAGGQVDGASLGIPNQAGDSQFMQRFALQTHDAFDQTAAMRFALEHQNPFATGQVNGGAAYPESSFSLVNISDPNVLLWTLKPAEDGIGQGVVARVWNLTGATRNFTLGLGTGPVARAVQSTHIETDRLPAFLQNGALSGTAGARQLVTYRLIPARGNIFDFDGDGKTDVSVFRPGTAAWYVMRSQDQSSYGQQWGAGTDRLAPADYDGDGKTDLAMWRPSNGFFYVLLSATNAFVAQQWGSNGDVPAPNDYDGDGKADYAVWRPSTGTFFALKSSDSSILNQPWGANGDVPVVADYDGDGKSDFAVWRPSSGAWYILQSHDNSIKGVAFGVATDKPAPGDFDGDGQADITVFRPADGVWYRLLSSTGSFATQTFGTNGDRPLVGDFDGDGKIDTAVFRPSSGDWYFLLSQTGSFAAKHWGVSGDQPVPAAFVAP
jgi:alpha-mannosidase